MSTESSASGGQLYVVSTPIGNLDDITIRAIAVLQSMDVIVCEEMKEARRLLDYYDINKELLELNEHNDTEATITAVKLLAAGKKIALISDAGTPVVADPGSLLVAAAIRYGYPVHVVPGPSSILTALVRSGMPMDQFLYAGMLSRKKDERVHQVRMLALEPRTMVLLDTPYRLTTVLGALAEVMPDRRAYIGCNLTMPNESHHYGTLSELHEHFKTNRFRGEYAIVIEGNPSAKGWYSFVEESNLSLAASDDDENEEATTQAITHDHNGQQVGEEAKQDGSDQSRNVQSNEQNDRTNRMAGAGRTRSEGADDRYAYRQEQRRFPRNRRSRDPQRNRMKDTERNRYDYEQPIVNYTLSNPYEQHRPTHQQPQQQHRARRRYPGQRKRWRR